MFAFSGEMMFVLFFVGCVGCFLLVDFRLFEKSLVLILLGPSEGIMEFSRIFSDFGKLIWSFLGFSRMF